MFFSATIGLDILLSMHTVVVELLYVFLFMFVLTHLNKIPCPTDLSCIIGTAQLSVVFTLLGRCLLLHTLVQVLLDARSASHFYSVSILHSVTLLDSTVKHYIYLRVIQPLHLL